MLVVMSVFALTVVVLFVFWVFFEVQSLRRWHRFIGKPFTTTPPAQQGPYDLRELFKRLDLAPGFQSTEKPAYRRVSIPKRNGRKRRLQIPDAPTHAVQRKILRLLLQRIPVHEAATGFEKGKSIVDHAQPHTESEVVICLDLVDFFPSTHARRVEAFFQRIGWNPETARWLTTWVCFNGGLPQGAPTSPKLSNLVNYLMDRQLQQSAERLGFRYTRYADDMTFSFSKHSNSAPPQCRTDHATDSPRRNYRPQLWLSHPPSKDTHPSKTPTAESDRLGRQQPSRTAPKNKTLAAFGGSPPPNGKSSHPIQGTTGGLGRFPKHD